MIKRYEHTNITWVDVVDPTNKEIREILDECNIPASFASDLTTMTPRTETIFLKGALKITLDFPIVKRTDIDHPHEIKFIATKKHLVTIRFEDSESVNQFTKEFEVSSILKNTKKQTTGAHLLLAMLSFLYETLGTKLDYLESKTQNVEENIFDNNEKELLFEISKISRRFIAFRHTVSAHEDGLSKLKEGVEVSFGKTYTDLISDLQRTYIHLIRRLVVLTTTLEELRDTNNALLTAKQNEVMKTLTIMAFITFPLTLFTSLFGMNTKTTPLVGHANDFWVIVGIMAVVSVGFFAFFKYKKWM